MEFRILGPLEIVGERGPVMLHRGKEQALLVFMLLHPNQVLPSERLIDELWDGRPPATAPKILQNAVSQLRKALGDGRLETRSPGYVFHLDEDELDVHRFERLAREGRPDEALALWRGVPLVELRDERFADEARRRLDEQRLAVLEDRIDADLASGRYAELLPELERLAAQHPLREQLHGQLIRALYASGRQGDALEAFRRARRTLNDELGLEPGPRLQELERQILNHDPALRTPETSRRLPAAPNRRRLPRFVLFGAGAVLLGGAIVGALAAFRGDDKPLLAKANSIAFIDTDSNRVGGLTPVDSQPRGIATDGSVVWIALPRNGTVQRLDPRDGSVRQTVGVGTEAIDLALGDGDLWVAGGNDGEVVRLDARNGAIKDTIRLPRREDPAPAWSVAFAGDSLWTTSGSLVLKFDPLAGSFVARNTCCLRAYDLAIGFGAVWVADFGTHLGVVSERTGKTLGVVDMNLYTDSLATGFDSVWLTVSNNYGSNATLMRIDPRTRRVAQTIPIGPAGALHSSGLPLTIGDGSVWVANPDRGDVLRISPDSGDVIETIHVGGRPWALAYADGRLWVTVD